FEQVRRSLPKELHGEYVLRIIARLKAATQDAKIYRGDGHLIAWTMDEKDPALLQEHLEGLRALFSAPLIVGDRQVDVGITFGVDITPSPDVVRRLASAVAAAEQTNETFDPIAVADSTSEEDLIWNVSLQARIDAALSNGEIYLVYQPKIMVQTGEIVGVEALVRWKDPVKGHIPPDNFIRQCETAGRMAHLTRFVLENACRAGNAFAERGINLPIAVNISATLVHERAIVELVENVLSATGFEPRRLTLEITETYRISNIDIAAEILGELHALGPKISMDDFGVGAASLEALLRLPFDELKIDRLFTSRITSDRKAAGIVENILRLGKDLRIIVVAEGVEDAGTLTKLRDSGCLVAQGFGISRPVEFEKIVSYQADREKRLVQNMV
ncbi:MAG: EAL domain-containing protein, partial [Alteraurantiacibacter sp.]